MHAKNMRNVTDDQKPVFYCKSCDYSCTKKFLWNQHIKTKKHENKNKELLDDEKVRAFLAHKNMPLVCECGKTYKHVQSFNRHLKECKGKSIDQEKAELRGMITTLICQNQHMLSENQEMREMLKDVIPKIGNTTITNKFNLQLFLNEQCKDAINLTEFVETLELGLSDLDETRQNGYVSGISSIIVRGLKELELHKRPIHCSDIKREVLYVKDNDTWERDNEDKGKMKQVIAKVANKQIDKIKEWEARNPNWNLTESGTKGYIEMVQNVTDGRGESEDKSNNRIIKTIAKEVIIEKQN